MADSKTNLMDALCTVSLHADSVWWHEAKDKYRLANLNLWVNVLRTQSQPPGANYEYYVDRVPANCRCMKKILQEAELPEEMIPDPEAWLKGHSWPTAIVSNFPALSLALVGEHSFCRGLELLSEKNLPYKVETSEEVKMYRKTCSESVKNIWSDPKYEDCKTIPPKQATQRRETSTSVNPNLMDYCPSVLQLHRTSNPQPTYPTITDNSYQSDLFPYHIPQVNVEQNRGQQWDANNNAVQQNPTTVYPQQKGESSREWREGPAARLPRNTAQNVAVTGNQRVQRPQQPCQQSANIGQQQSYHMSANIGQQHTYQQSVNLGQQQSYQESVNVGQQQLYQKNAQIGQQQSYQQFVQNSQQQSYQQSFQNGQQQSYQKTVRSGQQQSYQQPVQIDQQQSYQQSVDQQHSYQQNGQIGQQQSYQQFAHIGQQQNYQQSTHLGQQQTYQRPFEISQQQSHQHPVQNGQQQSFQQSVHGHQQSYQQTANIGQQQYHSQPILLSSDFPELPHIGNEQPVHPGQTRRPFLPDPGNFIEGRGEEISEAEAWLQNVYPQRAAEFSTMAELGSKLDEVAKSVVEDNNQEDPGKQPPQAEPEQVQEQGPNSQEGRRLYGDVLASKTLDEDSETNMDDKFEELEREALEQYFSSQNDIDEVPEAEISAEVEEKFLDLEREAMEQYKEQGYEIEEQPLKKEAEGRSPWTEGPGDNPKFPEYSRLSPTQEFVQKRGSTKLPPMAASAQQKSSYWVQEQPVPCWPTPGEEASEESRNPETPRNLFMKEEEAKPKYNIHPVEGKRRGRKEPAPTPSCVRLSCRGPAQEAMSPGRSARISEKWEKRYGGKSSKSSRSKSSYQERNAKKSQDSFRKSYYKKKEPRPMSTFQQNKKRPPPLSVVDREVKSLLNCLKARTLNFLKDADIRTLMEEHSKGAVRELLYKKQPTESIRKEVKVADIQDTDTLRLYVREISSLARQQMQIILKRVRDDVVDMASKKTIFITQPTTAEKRKVRYYIKKCLELMEKAESLKKMPKKPLESSKKEISDALATIHKTMDVVYLLRDMCRETYEDMEYLKSSRETVVEILLGRSFLEDKSEYIRQRVEKEKLSVLLYCLFPKRESVLFDREWAKLSSKTQAIYMFFEQQQLNNNLLINHQSVQWGTGLKQARFVNWMTANRPRRKELWSEDTWKKCLIIGCHSRPVDVFVEGRRSELLVPVFRREEVQESQTKMEQESKSIIEEKIDGPAYILKPPRKRKAGTKSDSELVIKQPTLATERSYWTWPKTYKTSNLLRLLKTQPKQKKKPVVKNDIGCSLM